MNYILDAIIVISATLTNLVTQQDAYNAAFTKEVAIERDMRGFDTFEALTAMNNDILTTYGDLTDYVCCLREDLITPRQHLILDALSNALRNNHYTAAKGALLALRSTCN